MNVLNHQAHNLDDLLLGQRMEDYRFVDSVEKFGPESLVESSVDRLPQLLVFVLPGLITGAEPKGFSLHSGGPQVAGHDDNCVPEINGPAVAVSQPSVLQDLEQDVEHIGMGFLDLVEEHHPVGPAAHRLGELSALFVAHVARRGADESRNGVLLHVFGHVDAYHVGLVGEHELG